MALSIATFIATILGKLHAFIILSGLIMYDTPVTLTANNCKVSK